MAWDRIWEIGELVCGKAPRRKNDSQITILKNNGLIVQFAGVGAAVMQRAKERGLARKVFRAREVRGNRKPGEESRDDDRMPAARNSVTGSLNGQTCGFDRSCI